MEAGLYYSSLELVFSFFRGKELYRPAVTSFYPFVIEVKRLNRIKCDLIRALPCL